MQKTNRLALAVLALLGSTAAFAQSSVTLYGRVNTTVERQEVGNVKTTGLFNNSSRFGFKGTEDLGGGLKAGFQLESGFKSDTGASTDPKAFFGRQSEVNLSGGFGAVRLGNFTAESYYATADYVSMHNHDTGSSSDALYAGVMRDVNKIGYRTPTFGGLTIDAAVSLHEAPAGTSGKNAFDLAANYNLGALALGAGYSKQGDVNQFAARALYTFGAFTVGGYVQRDENGHSWASGKRNSFRLAGAYNLGASEFHVNVGRTGEYKNTPDSDATQYTVGYNYNLSKRTKVYGYYTRINNSRAGTYGFNQTVVNPGVDSNTLAVGIRHKF